MCSLSVFSSGSPGAWLVLGMTVAVVFVFLDFLAVFSCGCGDKSCLFAKSVNVKSLYE